MIIFNRAYARLYAVQFHACRDQSAALVEQVQDSDLSDFNLVTLMLDAVILSDGLVATVTLEINTDGQKRILGFRVDNSENQQVCADLLDHLVVGA